MLNGSFVQAVVGKLPHSDQALLEHFLLMQRRKPLIDAAHDVDPRDMIEIGLGRGGVDKDRSLLTRSPAALDRERR